MSITVSLMGNGLHSHSLHTNNHNLFSSLTGSGLDCSIATTQQNVCNGDASAILRVTPSGGCAPFSYAWSHDVGLNSPIASNLVDGLYEVTITDNEGQQTTCDETIVDPSAIGINDIVESHTTCNLDNGSLMIMAVPTTGSGCDLSYSIDGGNVFQPSNLFQNLVADTYDIVIQDCFGCSYNTSTVINPSQGISVDFDKVCLSEEDPVNVNINVMITGGAPPFTFNWVGPNGFTSADVSLTNVLDGIYSVTITDQNGCSYSDPIEMEPCPINEENEFPLDCIITETQANTCANGSDIQLSIVAMGGTPPYNYAWSHNGSLTSSIATNLSAGTYTVTVTDAESEMSICSVTSDDPTPIAINDIIESNPTCGADNGSISILAVPTTGSGCDLFYSIDGGVNFQDNALFTNLGAGNYDIVVEDCFACTSIGSTSLNVLNGVTAELNKTCYTSQITPIQIDLESSIVSGTGPFNYSWSGPNGFTSSSESLYGVDDGVYTLNVTDANGCYYSISSTTNLCLVAPGNNLMCNINVLNNNNCPNGNQASLSVVPEGGSAPYSYSWSHNIGFNSSVANNLSGGSYTVTVTDNDGEQTVCSRTLVDPIGFNIAAVNAENANCNVDNGNIEILVTGSVSATCDLAYSIDNGTSFQPSNVFSNVADGNYQIIVEDCNGCFVTASANIIQTGTPSIQLDGICNSNGNADISSTVSGGFAPYTYTWSGPNGFASNGVDLNNVEEGTYTLNIEDQAGCIVSNATTVENCCDLVLTTCPTTTVNLTCPSQIPGIADALLNNSSDGGLDEQLLNNYGIFVSDACDDIVVNVVDTYANDDCTNGPITFTRLFSISDGVTQVTCSVDYSVNDDTAPLITTAAANREIVCAPSFDTDFNTWLLTQGGAIATESCSSVSWFTIPANPTYVLDGTIDVTFVAVDDCGNAAQTSASYTAVCSGNIGRQVWFDENGNGIQDFGEQGIANVQVDLFAMNGTLMGTQLSDSNGNYLFPNLRKGNYYVQFTAPDGYELTFANQGFSDMTDSDVNGSNGVGTTQIIQLDCCETNLSVSAGFYRPIRIGERTWYDSNQNDVWDPIENGINGLQVEIYRDMGGNNWVKWGEEYTGLKPGTPSDDGYFKFDVPPGDYYLKFVNPPYGLVPARADVGSDNTIDSDVTNRFGTGTTNVISAISGWDVCDIGAGYYPMGQVGNRAWFDDNSNGIADVGEVGVEDMTIEIYNSNTGDVIESTTTDINGNYNFDYLQKESYFLRFYPPAGYIATNAHVGQDDNIDSDADNTNGIHTTSSFAITPGDSITTLDIGIVEGAAVPLAWLEFYGSFNHNHNELNWTIANEINISHYELERTISGEEFQMISSVDAISQTVLNERYTQLDYDIEMNNEYFYRVKKVSNDGSFEYSDIIAIKTRGEEKLMSFYPNPTMDIIQVDMDNIEDNTTVSIISLDGKKVDQWFIKEISDQSIIIDVRDIPQGTYYLRVVSNRDAQMEEFVKVN